ncbi:MAG: thrombospondin type 3 repeat-containing protein [Acidobacteriota bacterium]
MRRGKFLVILLVVAFVAGGVSSVFANNGYLNDWKAAYPNSASATFSCSLCHTSAPSLNAYGAAVVGANFNFTSIESRDSDGDGATNIAEITAGTNPGDGNSKPAPTPVECTDYSYSAWSACDANGQQTRTQNGYLPANCTGTPSAQPVLTQSCTPPTGSVACTDYTYSEWSACANGQQTRAQNGYLPANCTGTPSAQPVLTQVCNSVPPPPTTGGMPVPTGAQVLSYQPVDQPVVSDDPGQAKPIGIGPLASGGNTVDLRVNIGPFSGPVDVSLVLYAPAIDSDDLYFIVPSVGLKRLSDAVRDEDEADRSTSSEEREGDEHPTSRRHLRNFIVWKANVTAVNEEIFTASVTALPSGLYPIVLVATSHDNPDNSYRWITYMFIP